MNYREDCTMSGRQRTQVINKKKALCWSVYFRETGKKVSALGTYIADSIESGLVHSSSLRASPRLPLVGKLCASGWPLSEAVYPCKSSKYPTSLSSPDDHLLTLSFHLTTRHPRI